MRPQRVVLFCGGRGSSNLIRELSLTEDVELTLIINAYDDGLSTGAIRDHIPGLLGPSDFRKNLSVLLATHSPEQLELSSLLEWRLPNDCAQHFYREFGVASRRSRAGSIYKRLAVLSPRVRRDVVCFLDEFAKFSIEADSFLDLEDVAFGNLVFAGSYLLNGRDFNLALSSLCRAFRVEANVVNVSESLNRFLVAIKADGSILSDEASIVSEQNDIPISEIFLLAEPLRGSRLAELTQIHDYQSRLNWLRSLEEIPTVSEAAKQVINEADLIVLGSGSQHSSLFPSYKILRNSNVNLDASKVVFVANLDYDWDIQGQSVADLIDNAERYLTYPPRPAIGRVLVDQSSSIPLGNIRPDITVDQRRLRSQTRPTVHSGPALADAILQRDSYQDRPSVELVIAGPNVRILSMLRDDITDLISTEFSISPSTLICDHHAVWQNQEIINAVKSWLNEPRSDYLVCVVGDGLYSARDVITGLQTLQTSHVPALTGSRIQSRKQWVQSSKSVHGEGILKSRVSRIGGVFLAFVFLLRFGVFQSDVTSGFRLFSSRIRLDSSFTTPKSGLLKSGRPSLDDLYSTLIRAGVGVGEFPVSYKAFASDWHSRAPLRRAWGILRRCI